MSELNQVLESIAELRTEFKNLEDRVNHKIDNLNVQIDNKINTFNERFDNYQKTTQWVVNLAFSLIASATLITVVSSVLRR
jgi:predicted PurR-regulated permease PerM